MDKGTLFSVDSRIAHAKTLDKAFYTSEKMFNLCRERIFTPSWQYIGHKGMVAEAGDVYPFTLLEDYLDEPLLLSHDQENQLHLLSNICTHRGNIMVDEPCKLNKLRCKYHGRQFQLDGHFHLMPEFKGVENFPTEDDNLAKLPLHAWSNLLFTSLGHNLPAELYLQDMMDRVNWMPLQHWALYCDNYLEGFHIPFVHPGLNSVIDFGNYTTELYSYSSLQLGLAKNDEDCFDLPESHIDYGKKVAAYYFFVFPNMMFNFYPWGLSVNLVRPVYIGESVVSFYTYVWKEDKLNKGAGSGLDIVEMEDQEVVQNVQKGVRSRFYKHGRYSTNREQGTHHFHRIIADMMG